ncbi:tRNA (adenosine(37)-N6)-threonylcarbamoyltransferase complex ATPase subunit type 1 TsaE [candidate division WS5 bacterium]|uniref:tRNA threonylcarbamoyladenosine biosynthesis protein TsaE n=1 Tax=candidate division WS5 bacterium TaxID=2093353 RepID=A0A419DG28_9BACT|nr:MAG: tRNA (adenosine(37)-N6)-threonylcarbamoyltransferase complex ATPase subunit type 1 TsaE [candidate division WS5 bacterium]
MKILSKSSDETVRLGEKLGESLRGGEIIALYGDLGGGKTQLTKGLAKGLRIKDNIISPTFVIRRDYRGSALNLLHYDFYRFEVPDQELIESLEEGINPDNVTVIEWAERVEKYLPRDTIKITFHYVSENEREIEVKGVSF